jgi:hypothetical protein
MCTAIGAWCAPAAEILEAIDPCFHAAAAQQSADDVVSALADINPELLPSMISKQFVVLRPEEHRELEPDADEAVNEEQPQERAAPSHAVLPLRWAFPMDEACSITSIADGQQRLAISISTDLELGCMTCGLPGGYNCQHVLAVHKQLCDLGPSAPGWLQGAVLRDPNAGGAAQILPVRPSSISRVIRANWAYSSLEALSGGCL